MKYTLRIVAIVTVFFLTFSNVIAQKKGEVIVEIPEFVISEKSNKIVYNEVVQQKGAPGTLYDKALAWANKFYKSPSNVLRTKDRGKALLIAKSRFYIYYTDPKKGTKTRTKTIEYILTFNFKDGRYRYEVTDIVFKSTSYQGIEQWIEANKKQYSYRYASNLVQIDEEIKKVIADFKAKIGAEEKGSDDW